MSNNELFIAGCSILTVVVVVIIIINIKNKDNGMPKRLKMAQKKMKKMMSRKGGVVSPFMSGGCPSCNDYPNGSTKYTKYSADGYPMNSNGVKEGFLDQYLANIPEPTELFTSPPVKSPFVGFLGNGNGNMSMGADYQNVEVY